MVQPPPPHSEHPPELVDVTMIQVTDGFSMAIRRRGQGGVPLLLVHGFPCTSLIWARVMQPLADAGFDVVAIDLRGYGDSDYAPNDFHDLAAFSQDLVHVANALGWSQFVVAAHDLGAAVAIDLANRYRDRVDRLVLLNHPIPSRPAAPVSAQLTEWTPGQTAAIFDYVERQGRDADQLVAELATPDQRRAYISAFYTHRMWCPPGAFTASDLDLLTAPYADARRLRTSFRDYEIVCGTHPRSAPELLDEPVQQSVIVLLGPDDVTLPPDAVSRCRIAYPNLVGPFVVPDTGHFMQWEQPTTIISTLRAFCRDLLTARTGLP